MNTLDLIKNKICKINNSIIHSSKFSIYGAGIFLVFVIFIVISALTIRNSFITNSSIAGYEIAHKNYLESTKDIDNAFRLSKMIAYDLSIAAQNDWQNPRTKEVIDKYYNYFKNLRPIITKTFTTIKNISFYGAVGTQIVSDWPEPEDLYINATKRHWYQEAVKHQGRAIIVDPYTDLITNNTTLTIACSYDGHSVFAVDFYLNLMVNDYKSNPNLNELSYFLARSDGTLLSYYTQSEVTNKSVEDFVKETINIIKTTKLENNLIKIEAPTGRDVNFFYYYDSEKDWYYIIALPYENILSSFTNIIIVLGLLVLIFFILEFFIIRRESKLRREDEDTTNYLNILANSYDALLRVDCKSGKIKVLKTTVIKPEFFATHPYYSNILDVWEEQAEDKEAFLKFRERFSFDNLLKRSKDNSFDVGYEILLKNPKINAYRWYSIRALFDVSYEIYDIILAFNEITSWKLKEIKEKQLLKDSISAVEENEKSKSQFFSGISHDMRTPLNGISGLCELATKYKDDSSKILSYINKIAISANQLLNLVNDLLDISKSDEQTTLNEISFKLDHCLKETLMPFHENAKIQQKSIIFNYKVKHNNVIGDKAKIIQILNNLVSNSLKYSNPGAKVEINVLEIKAREKDQYVFTIKDNGIGMSESYLKNLFIPYVREERLLNVGTGLGMPMVKNLVNKMHGSIEVKSKINVGTTITVTLPLKIDNSKDLEEKKNLTCSLNQDFSFKGLKILLVEDNELNMEIASDILSIEGAIITKAWNGKEAVDIFTASDVNFFDAILMDLKMPVMNGLEASITIRSLDRADAQTIPIIAVTANAFAEDITATQQAGMDSHISKPINFNILKDTLNVLIKKSQWGGVARFSKKGMQQ